MPQRAWAEYSYAISESKPREYDSFERATIPGGGGTYSVYWTIFDANETSAPWYPGWEFDPNTGNDYYVKSLVGIHFSEPDDVRAAAPGFESYSSAPRKYEGVTVERSEVPTRFDVGGVDDLEAAGFGFDDGFASISLRDLRATGAVELNLANALRHVAVESAKAIGAGSAMAAALRVESVGRALEGFMGDAFDVLNYGLRNFETASAADYEKRADALLRGASETFLAEAEAQLGAGTAASSILRSINLAGGFVDGSADIEMIVSRRVELLGPGILVASAELGLVVGSRDDDVVVNQGGGANGGSRSGQSAYLGVSSSSDFDFFDLRGGADLFLGARTAEHVRGGASRDALYGYGGGDLLSGGVGSDRIFGGVGGDVLHGGAGGDRIYGGAGVDTAEYLDSARGVAVDIRDNVARRGDASGDVLRGVENLGGSLAADVLKGDDRANLLVGRSGEDALYGRGGADRLQGGRDGDRLYGGAGDDVIEGGRGADLLYAGSGRDMLSYEDDARGVDVSLEAKRFEGGDAEGDRAVGFVDLSGGRGRDRLEGDARGNILHGRGGADAIHGRDGPDTLHGGSGKDALKGGPGSDVIYGGQGDDVIAGGQGDDRLHGGAGRDTFRFTPGHAEPGEIARDTIWDFERGADVVDLTAFRLGESREAFRERLSVQEGISLPVVGGPPPPVSLWVDLSEFGQEIELGGVRSVSLSDFLW